LEYTSGAKRNGQRYLIMGFKYFANTGVVESKLSNEAMNKLKSYIRNKKNKHNAKLAGNISESFYLEDKDNWFFNNVLTPLIKEYSEEDLKAIVKSPLTENCAFVLSELWVNMQNKYEFNPLHHHAGVFSFVIWVKIPSSYKKEKKLKFIRESNTPTSNTFEFLYTNILGSIVAEKYYLEPEDEGTIILFPAHTPHQVYPFYLSNKKRISVSGNIKLDPKKII
jgi:hypothetical protein